MRKTSLFASLLCLWISTCALAIDGDMGVGIEPLTDGSGTYPYLIEDVNDFDTFANPNNAATYWAAGVHTKLTTNIDLSTRTYTTAVIAPDKTPLNATFDGPPFSGVFDGDAHIISNIMISASAYDGYLAVFGQTNSTASIKKVAVKQVSIVGGLYSGNIGLLCGANFGRIESCCATGTISIGNNCSRIGLICGINYGNIAYSYSIGTINGGDNAYNFGGLCGVNHGYSEVSFCYAATDFILGSNSRYIESLANNEEGRLINCVYDTEISGIPDSTGRRGFTTAEMKTTTPYSNNKWAGDKWRIDIGMNYPRLAWENSPGILIEDPIVTLIGIGTEPDPWQITSVADLHLITEGTYYWDKYYILTSNIDFSGTGMASIGFDNGNAFEGIFDGNDFTIENITINDANGYQVGVFGYVGSSGQVKNLKIDNVNLTVGYRSGGLCSFNSGQIKNCFIGGSIAGFGEIGGLCWFNAGEINNCSVDISITRSNCCIGSVGGLCTFNVGLIEQCSSTGKIINIGEEIANNWGGICARNDWGIINKSFSSVSISGAFLGNAGGLCGYNSGLIENSYAYGTVIAGIDSSYVGGFCGYSKGGAISNCYSTGSVTGGQFMLGGFAGSGDNISDCFWDVEKSGMPDPEGGVPDSDGMTGLSTAEMMTQSTFANWDFSEGDGDPADWMILRELEDYPRLAWQEVFAGDIAGLYGVDMVDFAYLASYWGLTGCNTGTDCGRADIDGSGDVDLTDLAAVASDWLK